jgi:hypothetical protein
MHTPIESEATGHNAAGMRSVAMPHAIDAMIAAWTGSHSKRELAGSNAASDSTGRTART